MTIELPPLDSEPLIYFLLHSGVFVTALALTFFLIGVALGRAAWGRYKSRARALAVETEAQRNEIVDLKRKLAEQTLRPLPAFPAAPAPTPSPEMAAPPASGTLEMPELANMAPPPDVSSAPPARPVTQPRVRPPSVATSGPARPPKPEPAAVAPFGFLSEEPAAPPPARKGHA
jgi:hypothetical protein